jgi:hypothetical protein
MIKCPRKEVREMSFSNKIKEFYSSKKEFLWLVVIVLVLFSVASNFGGSSFKSVGGYAESSEMMAMNDAPRMMKSASFASEGMAADMHMPQPELYEQAPVEDEERKIRKTANMQLEVEKTAYESAKAAINVVIDSNSGFYTSKNENKHNWYDSHYKTYNIAFKVPKDGFEETIESLRAIGEVKNLNVDSYDMTTQYQDIQADLDSKEKVKARVAELLVKAEDIKDVITIEEKLANLQREIDNYNKRLTNIDRQTDYSTISVQITEKHDVKDTFYEMTPVKEHLENVIISFDDLFSFLSRTVAFIIGILVLFGLYKGYKRITR